MTSIPQDTRAADCGRMFQHQFVESLSSQLFNLVQDAIPNLEGSKVEDIQQALDLARLLNLYAVKLEHNQLEDVWAEDLLFTVPQATQLIWKLGGTYTDGISDCVNPNANTAKKGQ